MACLSEDVSNYEIPRSSTSLARVAEDGSSWFVYSHTPRKHPLNWRSWATSSPKSTCAPRSCLTYPKRPVSVIPTYA